MKTMEPNVVGATDEFATRLFTPRGTDYLKGTEIVKSKVLNLDIDPEQVPPLPFSDAELERSRKLGQFLVYHSGLMKTGKKLTMAGVWNNSENVLGEGNLLYHIDWYCKDPFFTKDQITPGWYLVGLDAIPDSQGKDYFGQTQVIADYLVEEVYKDQVLHDYYTMALDEWINRKEAIQKVISKDWKEGAKQVSELQINRLFRETAVQAFYNNIAYFEVNGKYLLPKMWTWTRTRSLDGLLVSVGNADPAGLRVDGAKPGGSGGLLGVRFFRGAVPNLES